MKKILFLVFIVLVAVSCNNSDEKSNNNNNEQIPIVKLSDFDSLALQYVDQKIEISGIVDHVCKHGGKKLFIVSKDGNFDIHVTSETRFNDSLIGNKVSVIGIVKAFIVDEAYCQQLEKDAQTNHSEGEDKDNLLKEKIEQAKYYRDSMQIAGVDHLSYYSLEFVSFK